MEADKPGWCDSLNGLPALFGSSICETFELKRAIRLLREALSKLEAEVPAVELCAEVVSFTAKLDTLLAETSKKASAAADHRWWDTSNSAKEDFREKTGFVLGGTTRSLQTKKLIRFLVKAESKLDKGIAKAYDKKSGLYPTYFRYGLVKYTAKKDRIIPQAFKRTALPLFLEGMVHALRVEADPAIVENTRRSGLYDKALKMYRLNESLERESLEIGRSRVFVPGWLENESIWLHMEYKYLLELLKQGFYKEFFKDFSTCCVCFFDPKVYGRNILENSSFIVSSAYPDTSLWGGGFVARLSGATAELLTMWAILCLGRSPFLFGKKEGLTMQFKPILPKEFFAQEARTVAYDGKPLDLPAGTFAFRLFSKTLVCYHNPRRKDTYSETAKVVKTVVKLVDGEVVTVGSGLLDGRLTERIRQAQGERIDVYIE